MTLDTNFPDNRYCVNCKHSAAVVNYNPIIGQPSESEIFPKEYRCYHPIHRSLVTSKVHGTDCRFERTMAGKCGPSGRNYETN